MDDQVKFSERVARRWLHRMNFRMYDYKKGLYYDGHEREDVKEYRRQFVQRFVNYSRRFPTYLGEDCSNVNEPILQPGELKLIPVMHDECCFAANDTRRSVWAEEGHDPIKKKGDGKTVMVSAFVCECH